MAVFIDRAKMSKHSDDSERRKVIDRNGLYGTWADSPDFGLHVRVLNDDAASDEIKELVLNDHLTRIEELRDEGYLSDPPGHQGGKALLGPVGVEDVSLHALDSVQVALVAQLDRAQHS